MGERRATRHAKLVGLMLRHPQLFLSRQLHERLAATTLAMSVQDKLNS